jgi:alkylation response protein AidB-like acyl-CoA dehydrogenase
VQEFIVNSPTDTSTKWWIGAAGQTATHSVVFARLILDEGDVGVHNFIVPIRDMETHAPLPGMHRPAVFHFRRRRRRVMLTCVLCVCLG